MNTWQQIQRLRIELRGKSRGLSAEEVMTRFKSDLIKINVLRAQSGTWKDKTDPKVH